MPLLSIIIPVYNNQSVKNAIESVIQYKDEDIELIVIDGGSTDGTMPAVEMLSKYINKIISEPDKGVNDALNKGIAMACGEWIFCLAADDILINNPIQIVKKNNKEDVDLIVGHTIMDYNNGYFSICKSENNLSLLDYVCSLRHPAAFFRKTVYERIGMYDIELNCAGDREFFLRMRKNNMKILVVDVYITLFRVGGISTTTRYKKAFVEDLLISDKYGVNRIKSRFMYLRRCLKDIKNHLFPPKKRFLMKWNEVQELLKN